MVMIMRVIILFVFLTIIGCGTGIQMSRDYSVGLTSPASQFGGSSVVGGSVVASGELSAIIRVSPSSFSGPSSQGDLFANDPFMELSIQGTLGE